MVKALLQEKTVTAPPSVVGFWDTAVGKTTRALIYLCASAVLTALVQALTNDPSLFGTYTPIVLMVISNVALVLGINVARPDVKNV